MASEHNPVQKHRATNSGVRLGLQKKETYFQFLLSREIWTW